MPDSRLRDALESEGRRVSLDPGAEGRMFERRDRRDRRRRRVTVAVGLVLVVVVVALALTALPRGADRRVPADPSAVIGSYVTRLSAEDPDVARLGLAGRYELRLSADGDLMVIGPPDVYLPGPPIGAVVEGQQLTTDLLVGRGCDAPGTYGWSREGDTLTLVPIDEACDLRRAVLATRPWSETAATSTDALQGEWVATFTCERMVGTVESADVSAHDEAFWRGAKAEALGSTDAEDPCAGTPPAQTYTLRFVDGRLQIFDQGPDEGFDGRYELEGDTLTIRDPRTRNIDGAYQLTVEFGEDSLSFTLVGRGATDPWFLSTWQVAPFEAR